MALSHLSSPIYTTSILSLEIVFVYLLNRVTDDVITLYRTLQITLLMHNEIIRSYDTLHGIFFRFQAIVFSIKYKTFEIAHRHFKMNDCN